MAIHMPVEEQEETKIQMAPMIDMVFLLIVFFMTASHLSTQKNMDLDIPEARSGTVPKERPDRWTVNILRDGTLFSGQQPVTIDGCAPRRGACRPSRHKVYLRADKLTPTRCVW